MVIDPVSPHFRASARRGPALTNADLPESPASVSRSDILMDDMETNLELMRVSIYAQWSLKCVFSSAIYYHNSSLKSSSIFPCCLEALTCDAKIR